MLKRVKLLCFVLCGLFIISCSSDVNESFVLSKVDKNVIDGLDTRYYAVCTVDEDDYDTVFACNTKNRDIICSEDMLMDNCIKYLGLNSNFAYKTSDESLLPDYLKKHLVNLPIGNAKHLSKDYYICEKFEIKDEDKNIVESDFVCFTLLEPKLVKELSKEACTKELLKKNDMSKKECETILSLILIDYNLTKENKRFFVSDFIERLNKSKDVATDMYKELSVKKILSK